ncbi:MAG: YlxR family protein [Ruminococcaceae bacterium]|nr:YlxR family protein [Oscillospiraceae bacterium]MBQ2757753.1 YlxR family protein [Clostridia bacterium]
MDKKMKKMPERQCLGCNGHFPKNTLLRVVRAPDGAVSLDFTGKKSGRGAYICKSGTCLMKAQRSGRLARNLMCEIPAEVYAAMQEELIAHE